MNPTAKWLPLLGLAFAACRIGEGDGDVAGFVFVRDCHGATEALGSLEQPAAYDMDPKFFAGEPIEDLLGRNNRLLLRVQPDGKRTEVNDALVFDVRSTFELARCVRGNMTADGKPDWDARTCDRSGTTPRIRVGPDEPVRASLTLLATCPEIPVVAVAVPGDGQTGPEWESWIEFEEFGSAGSETGPVDQDFKISFNERLHASGFHLTLDDDQAVTARREGREGVKPAIAGVLDGFFDFDLQRGRAGQAFP